MSKQRPAPAKPARSTAKIVVTFEGKLVGVNLPTGFRKIAITREQYDQLRATSRPVHDLVLSMVTIAADSGRCTVDDLIRAGFDRATIDEHGAAAQALAAQAFGTDADAISFAREPRGPGRRARDLGIDWKLLACGGSFALYAGETRHPIAAVLNDLEFDRANAMSLKAGNRLILTCADGQVEFVVMPFDDHGIARAIANADAVVRWPARAPEAA